MKGDEHLATPYFVYGTLKPDEIAFYQIKDLIEVVKPAQVKDFALYIRDGIPLIFKSPNWPALDGYLIWPKQDKEVEIEKTLNAYEGDRLYIREKIVATYENKQVDCFTYVGRNPVGSNAEPLHGSWFGRDDTIFSNSFPSLFKNIKNLVRADISSGPDIDDWDYYNELTSKYLLLVTIIERLAYLFCGEVFTIKEIKNDKDFYNDRIMKRITALGKCSQFQEAYKEVEKLGLLHHVEIFDSRDARKRLNSKRSKEALESWYQVRSNLQHRGKSARKDVRTVRDSLVSLANIMSILLPKLLPGIDKSISFQQLETNELIKIN